MTFAGLLWRRKRLVFFVAIGIVVLSATTVGLHLLASGAPLWMAGIVAVVPTSIVARVALAIADRWGWFGGVIVTPEGRQGGKSAGPGPRWIAWVGDLVVVGLFVWSGGWWDDHWRRVYPTAPAWMFFAVIVAVAMLAGVAVEAVLAQVVERLRASQNLAP